MFLLPSLVALGIEAFFVRRLVAPLLSNRPRMFGSLACGALIAFLAFWVAMLINLNIWGT